jgi:hypothetical protein
MQNDDLAFQPQARNDRLVSSEISDELLLFDLQHKRIHCLNHTAARVWRACNGQRSVSQIAAEIAPETPESVDAVWLALEQLSKSNLLVGELPQRPEPSGMSRRDLIRKLGTGAIIAVPLITSLLAPRAVQAVSCLSSGAPCSTSVQCCSGICSGTCA